MSIQPANRINSVKEYYFSTKLKEVRSMQSSGMPVINLGIGNPDLEADTAVVDELVRSTNRTGSNYYQPYRGLPALQEAFAEWYERIYGVNLDPEKEILPLMGSKEGIMHVSMAFTDPGDQVLVPDPGYPTYASASRLLGVEVIHYNLKEETGWIPDMHELDRLCSERVRIIWLNYPHMPSGTKPQGKMFDDLVGFARERNVLLAHDNPYSLINTDHPISILKHDPDKEHVIELNSLSKSHNMAGWRVGCMAGNADHMHAVLKVKSNMDSGMFKPIQEAAVKALQADVQWFDELNNQYRKRRKLVEEMCCRLSCSYRSDGAGLFVWAKIPDNYPHSYAFSDYLLYEKNIFVTPGSVFGRNGKEYIRISLCAPESQLEEAMIRIKK